MPETTKQNADKIKCYGKHVECEDRASCELGAACLSHAREESDNIHYQFQNISVPQISYDPNDDAHDEEDAISKAYFESEDDQSIIGNGDFILDGITIPADMRPLVIDIIRRLAEIKQTMPRVLDSLFDSVIHGKSQAEQARERKVTRACVNKWLLKELGVAQKRNDIQARRDQELQQAKIRLQLAEEQAKARANIFKEMSHREFAIYKICSEDGCLSVSSVSKQLGYSRKTIYKGLHNLRSKYGISVTVYPWERKKK